MPKQSSGIAPLERALFAAETAVMLADVISIHTRSHPSELASEIRPRICSPIWSRYLRARQSSHQIPWMTRSTNRNAVCHHGVLGSSLTLRNEPALLTRMLQIAGRHLPSFLGGLARDGGCRQGPAYWTFDLGRCAWLNWWLETRTQGTLSLLDSFRPIVTRMARAQLPFVVGEHQLIAFSDGRKNPPFDPRLYAHLGSRLAAKELSPFTARLYKTQAKRPPAAKFAARANLFEEAHRILFRPWEKVAETSLGWSLSQPVHLPDLRVWISQGRPREGFPWVLAGKGVSNAEPHLHDNVGNIVLFVNGQEFPAEPGTPAYCRELFGSQRYRFLAAHSWSHSVPVIAGCEQWAVPNIFAIRKKVEFSPRGHSWLIDLSAAYPAAAGILTVHREVRPAPSKPKFPVSDAICLRRKAMGTASAFLTCSQPRMVGNGVILGYGGMTYDSRPEGKASIGAPPCRNFATWNTIPLSCTASSLNAIPPQTLSSHLAPWVVGEASIRPEES